MILIGIALSASPIVYRTIERTEFVRVGLVLVFLVVALVGRSPPTPTGTSTAS